MTELDAILAKLPGLADRGQRRGGQHDARPCRAPRRNVPAVGGAALCPLRCRRARRVRVRITRTRFGWRLTEVDAGEVADPRVPREPGQSLLFLQDQSLRSHRPRDRGPIASGANLDDLGDYRPGLIAAAEHRVRHPFVEAGMDKAAVRALARTFDLGDIAELPAQPCLSSRVETGIAISARDLAFVARMERALAPTCRKGPICAAASPTAGSSSRHPEPDEAMQQIADELRRRAAPLPGLPPYRRGAGLPARPGVERLRSRLGTRGAHRGGRGRALRAEDLHRSPPSWRRRPRTAHACCSRDLAGAARRAAGSTAHAARFRRALPNGDPGRTRAPGRRSRAP